MSELLNCPFCGGEAKFVHIFENPDKCMVSCRECDGGIDAVFASEDEAVAAWNRRAQPANDPLTLEQMVEKRGEPLWYRPIGEGTPFDYDPAWFICNLDNLPEPFCSYGKTWLAYDHKQGGEQT